MESLFNLLVSLITALVGALAGALATHLFQRRRASDREVLQLWRSAFDRSAFKGPYLWHSSQDRFKEAIELTLQCVNAGVLENRKGTVLGKAKPKALIRNAELRSTGDAVERKLNRIRELIPEVGDPRATQTAEAIDSERNEIVNLLNGVFKKAKLPVLPRPTEAKSLEDVFEE